MARPVRIVSISYNGEGNTVEQKRERGLRMLAEAAVYQPDIVCLPETFTTLGLPCEAYPTAAETVPGPTTDAAAELARKHRMYVICPIVQKTDTGLYNSAVVINRDGEILGAYHKMHPTIWEIESGVIPGTEPKTFETDFGRIGCAICFDLNHRDVIEGLASNGAEVVFFPSMYCGGLQLQIWAHDFSVFIVSAHSGGKSAVVDPLGRVLKWSSTYEQILYRQINLDGAVFHIDYNNAHWDAIRRKYGPAVEIDIATDEAKFRLVSHHPNITVSDIASEFGLEPLPAYFSRAAKIREKMLSNTQNAKQEAPNA